MKRVGIAVIGLMGIMPCVAKPYRVAATVGMIADVVREIAGEYASVEGIIGEGVDPHLYKPTRGDVVTLSRADIIFYNGLLLEGKMEDVLNSTARKGKPVYAVTEDILRGGGYVMSGVSKHYDPHVWMDVQGWMKAVELIEKALSGFDSAHAADYAANAGKYRERLQRLDDYVRGVFESIPKKQRVLVTAHDAFRYMGRAYGLEVRGIQGLSTASEAGIKDIENLIDFLVSRGVPAVFVESSVSDKNVRALVEGAAARGHEVKVGGTLFSDAMGTPGTYEGTYIGMIDHNATMIAAALGGNPPRGGMQGRLSYGR